MSLLIAIAILALSGLPGLLMHRRSMLGQHVATGLNLAGSLLGLFSSFCIPHSDFCIHRNWSLPLGSFSIANDNLTRLFLIPVFLISALGSIYGHGYWSQTRHPGNGRRLRCFWGLLAAGMAMVLLARDGVLLLMAWEIMALSAFFLVCTEENKAEARNAAWVYLIATHLGTLCLIGFFALLSHVTGSFDLWPTLPANVSPKITAALFALGVVGFGMKAGIFPLHIWLPGAHANAPSHVSAVMSGVMLKMGVYGLVRVAALSPHPPIWTGAVLLIVGTATAILGIAFACAQNDLKRLLAYSSIENIGIIVMGIGLATLGRTLHRDDFIVLGLGAALLHVLNHSCFKPLLFMGAGGILNASRTRKMDLLGGLGKRMPRSFILFIIGGIAICGLPPLNGFISELMLYIGLFKAAGAPGKWGWIALAAPALATVGAMAVASFVKLIGSIFGGNPRTDRAAHAHEAEGKMLGPMWILAALCVAVGVIPALAVGLLNRAIAEWTPQPLPSVTEYLPVMTLSIIAIAMLTTITAACIWFYRSRANRSARTAGTWDCGYIRPTARMQYTGSAFSQMLVELMSWILWPIRSAPRLRSLFAPATHFETQIPDVVLDRGMVPAFSGAERMMSHARAIQRGPIQIYLLYVLGIVILLLLFG